VPLGPEGWRYSADDAPSMAARVRDVEAKGYGPVALHGDIVLLQRGNRDASLQPALDDLVAALESGTPR